MSTYITETWLRERFGLGHGTEVHLPADARLTPAAQGLLDERKIVVRYEDDAGRMFVNDAPQSDAPALRRVHPLTGASERQQAQCLLCHQPVTRKPDTLTHLDGGHLVSKNDPRLKLRGKLDTTIAQAVLVQAAFEETQLPATLKQWLADLRSALGNALKAEVTGEPMPVVTMGEFDTDALHAMSHDPLKYIGHDHMVPEVSQGTRVASLNLLRAMIREAELCAADLYIGQDFTVSRPDVMAGLNRLSSAAYVLMLMTYMAEQGKTVPAGRRAS